MGQICPVIVSGQWVPWQKKCEANIPSTSKGLYPFCSFMVAGGGCFRDGWTNLNQTWHGGTFCDSIQDFNPTSPLGGSAPPQKKGKILFCGPILTKFGMVIPLATYFKILPFNLPPRRVCPPRRVRPPPKKGELLLHREILTKELELKWTKYLKRFLNKFDV